MAAVDDYPAGSPGQSHFPTTLEPYLGAVLVRVLEYFRGLCLTLFSIN